MSPNNNIPLNAGKKLPELESHPRLELQEAKTINERQAVLDAIGKPPLQAPGGSYEAHAPFGEDFDLFDQPEEQEAKEMLAIQAEQLQAFIGKLNLSERKELKDALAEIAEDPEIKAAEGNFGGFDDIFPADTLALDWFRGPISKGFVALLLVLAFLGNIGEGSKSNSPALKIPGVSKVVKHPVIKKLINKPVLENSDQSLENGPNPLADADKEMQMALEKVMGANMLTSVSRTQISSIMQGIKPPSIEDLSDNIENPDELASKMFQETLDDMDPSSPFYSVIQSLSDQVSAGNTPDLKTVYAGFAATSTTGASSKFVKAILKTGYDIFANTFTKERHPALSGLLLAMTISALFCHRKSRAFASVAGLPAVAYSVYANFWELLGKGSAIVESAMGKPLAWTVILLMAAVSGKNMIFNLFQKGKDKAGKLKDPENFSPFFFLLGAAYISSIANDPVVVHDNNAWVSKAIIALGIMGIVSIAEESWHYRAWPWELKRIEARKQKQQAKKDADYDEIHVQGNGKKKKKSSEKKDKDEKFSIERKRNRQVPSWGKGDQL